MSATAPYSQAARGRVPFRPIVRVMIVGLAIVGVVMSITLMFVMPWGKRTTTLPPPTWTAGVAMTMPAVTVSPPPPPPAPTPDSFDTPPVPGPPPIASGPRPMAIWGADNGPITRAANAIGDTIGGHGAGGDQPPADGPAGNTEYASRLKATPTEDGEAAVYKDISLMLAETTTFSCIPKSPIDTQLVGGVACIVDEPVWSADGSNILIDKGAVVSGEIQRELEDGQDRAFILWRSIRSKRVYAQLNSPAVDELGQMGVPGIVNEHLWKKIKATLILTAIEGFGNVATTVAQRGDGNSYVNFNNGQSLASQSLARDLNIPTTLWRGQAWPLKVYVQHNVFFHRAYNNVLLAGQS